MVINMALIMAVLIIWCGCYLIGLLLIPLMWIVGTIEATSKQIEYKRIDNLDHENAQTEEFIKLLTRTN